jgi:hypothetical protein
MTAALAITVCVAALAGCAGPTPSIEAAAARQLQSSVVAIAQSAAAGNASRAMSRLDALNTAVQADTASGAITGKRAAAIRAAIAKVRADLTAAIQSKPPTAAPSPDSSGSGSSSTPSSTPVPTTGGAGGSGQTGGSGSSGGSTPPPATSTSSPSDSPTTTPSAPPPTSGSTSGP